MGKHIERLLGSCRYFRLKMPLDKNELSALILHRSSDSGLSDIRLRIAVTKNRGKSRIEIAVKAYHPFSAEKYRQGFKVGLSKLRQHNLEFAQHKTTQRKLYDLNLLAANKLGFDEALIVNKQGYCAEACRSNIFFVRSGELFTPSLECGCLKGITRMAVIGLAKDRQIRVNEGRFKPEEFFSSEEAFLTNSLMGIIPLWKRCGRITKSLIKGYSCLLS